MAQQSTNRGIVVNGRKRYNKACSLQTDTFYLMSNTQMPSQSNTQLMILTALLLETGRCWYYHTAHRWLPPHILNSYLESC